MQITPNQKLILGPPGCGKTTRCLNIIEAELAAGVEPNRIAYVSFTKKAIEEAVSRATARFNYKREDFMYFRTLHSLCYMLLRLKRTDVMGKAHFVELGEMLGYKFSDKAVAVEDGVPVDGSEGDKLRFIDNLARNRMVSLADQWHEVNDCEVDFFALQRLHDSFATYKAFHNVLDYTDMLEQVVKEQLAANVDVVVIDEAQDLSRLQWGACKAMFKNAKRVYIAGDDDQAIYRWSGADVEQFLKLGGEREVLGHSYRLPRSVHSLACRTIAGVKHRFDKQWAARDDEGMIERLPHLDAVQFSETESTYVLARAGYMLNDAESMLRKSGRIYMTRYGDSSVVVDHYHAIRDWERLRKGATVSGYAVGNIYSYLRPGTGIQRGFKGDNQLDPEAQYSATELREHHGLIADGIWHDALDGIALNTREYYLTALRAGAKLNEAPRIRISTIHSAKGGEADNVILLTGMSQRSYNSYQRDPDDEIRVFYVGMTRARKRLTLIDGRDERVFQV